MYLLLRLTYGASVRFLPSVSPHVNDEHVLCLKRLLLPRATDPLADERLLVGPDVVHVQVLKAGVGRIGSGFAFYSPIYGSLSFLRVRPQHGRGRPRPFAHPTKILPCTTFRE